MDIGYTKIIITIFLAVIGWLVGHFYTNQRSIITKQRNIVTEHLIKSYNILTNDISNRKPSDETQKKLELLLSEIQLFGSKEQIKLIKELSDNLSSNKDLDLNPLINDLRNDLRNRLKLSEVTGNVMWLRSEKKSIQQG